MGQKSRTTLKLKRKRAYHKRRKARLQEAIKALQKAKK